MLELEVMIEIVKAVCFKPLCLLSRKYQKSPVGNWSKGTFKKEIIYYIFFKFRSNIVLAILLLGTQVPKLAQL